MVLSRALLSLWATWFSVVLASNVADALKEAGILAPTWRFASGNYSLLAESVSLYAVSPSGAAILFALVLLLELAAAGLFWRAALVRDPLSPDHRPGILRAFFTAIVLFGGFLVFDEILLIYGRFPNLETSHFVVLCALLLSVLLIHVLGERRTSD